MTSHQAIVEANKRINNNTNDDYVAVEDELIRKRMKELDPVFMAFLEIRYRGEQLTEPPNGR